MNIVWEPQETMYQKMAMVFRKMGKKAISMNHYDFQDTADGSQFQLTEWKQFLADPRVQAYIDSEFEIIKQAEFRKLISNIHDSKAVGQAQILNSLAKMMESDEAATQGPAFIYCYIPLTQSQECIDTVEVQTDDPFLKEGSS